jgi:glycosyltransferase involved in cell wall biosynthesis
MHALQILEACSAGARKHVRYLCQGLREAGDQVDLVYSPLRADPDFADDLALYERLGVRCHPIPMRHAPSPSDLGAICQLRRILRERRPDLLHAHATKAGFIGRLAACGLRSVYSPHAFCFQAWRGLKRAAGRGLERALGYRTDLLIAISASEAAIAREILPPSRVCEVRNGIPELPLLEREAARRELGLNGIVIGMAARLAPQKAHSELLAAIAAVPEVTTLLLWGDGPLRGDIERQIRELRISERVRLLGHLPAAERYFSALDVGVLPSHYEGLSYQLLEMLAAGLPVIASDIPGNRLPESENPIHYVPLRSPQALADAIGELAAAPERRRALGAAGQALVRTHYRLSDQITAIRRAYAMS